MRRVPSSEPDTRRQATTVLKVPGTAVPRQLGRVLRRAIEGEVRDFPRGWLLHRRRAGVECPRGDGLVERFASAGRHGYVCPACQAGHVRPRPVTAPACRIRPGSR